MVECPFYIHQCWRNFRLDETPCRTGTQFRTAVRLDKLRWTVLNHEWIERRECYFTKCHHTAMLTMCVRWPPWQENNKTNQSKTLNIDVCSCKNIIKTWWHLVLCNTTTLYKIIFFLSTLPINNKKLGRSPPRSGEQPLQWTRGNTFSF